MLDTLSLEELNTRVSGMTEEDKQHFRMVLTLVLRCYGEGSENHALLIHSHPDSPAAEFMTINCSDMEATEILNIVSSYMNFASTADAPPKEKFN
jgi:hypothetical protein